MLRTTLLAAFAVTTVSAFGQNDMMSVDAKSSKPKELMSFIEKDAYKKISSGDAYVLVTFLGDLPGNYQTAVLRGLVRISQEAMDIKMKNQTAANAMAPMGDRMPDMSSSYSNSQRGERSFEKVTMDPEARVSYLDTIKLLQISQDETDRGLIQSLFSFRPFTASQVMTTCNERELDAIERYIKALAMSTEPTRLKYTSLAPHMYTSPVIPR